MNKKKPTTAKPSLKETDRLTLLARAVAAEYKGDPSGAGIVVAHLPSGEFYVSVVRYREPYGKNKVVVCSAKGPTAEDALVLVSRAWLDEHAAQEALRSSL